MESKRLQGGRGKQKKKGGAFIHGEDAVCPGLNPGGCHILKGGDMQGVSRARSLNDMKTASRFGLVSLFAAVCGVYASDLSAQVPDVPETFPNGVVYGPKAAFAIAAPNGWVLDNKSGAVDGLPCVLYPKDTTWQTSPVVMYAKIASTTRYKISSTYKCRM